MRPGFPVTSLFPSSESNRELLEFERKIRDPVHDYVPLTQLECHLIDTPAFQRLDRIGQMHTVHKVYPSANYSRKVHSLGTMHLAGKAIARILYFQDRALSDLLPSPLVAGQQSRVGYAEAIDDVDFLRALPCKYDGNWSAVLDELIEDRGVFYGVTEEMNPRETLESAAWVWQAARLVALLHDCGHGPFSHMLENVEEFTFDHEAAAIDVIDVIREEVSDSLSDEEATFVDGLVDFVTFVLSYEDDDSGNDLAALTFFLELVNSPYDCDMLDYIVRDAYFAGTLEYGQADVDRIVKGFVYDEGRLKISESQTPALANAFESLFNMYETVYTHKTARMYNVLLEEAFSEVADLLDTVANEALVDYDEGRLVAEIERKAARQADCDLDPDDGNDFEAAWEKLEQFLDREKPYEQFASEVFVLEVADIRERSRPIDTARETIADELTAFIEREEVSGVEIKYDDVHPIKRISEDIKWVWQNVLYVPAPSEDDPDKDDHFVDFASVDREVSNRLQRAEVPVHLFLNRDTDPETVARLKDEAEDLFSDIREELGDEPEDGEHA